MAIFQLNHLLKWKVAFELCMSDLEKYAGIYVPKILGLQIVETIEPIGQHL